MTFSIKRLRARRIYLEKLRNERRSARLIKTRMLKQQQEREQYFASALLDYDNKVFLEAWSNRSKETLDEVMLFVARSLATVEGFELANRALKENLDMENAEIDIKPIIDFSKRISRISFFEFVLNKNEMSDNARQLALIMFIAKEYGYERDTVEKLMKQSVDAIRNPEPIAPSDKPKKPKTREQYGY